MAQTFRLALIRFFSQKCKIHNGSIHDYSALCTLYSGTADGTAMQPFHSNLHPSVTGLLMLDDCTQNNTKDKSVSADVYQKRSWNVHATWNLRCSGKLLVKVWETNTWFSMELRSGNNIIISCCVANFIKIGLVTVRLDCTAHTCFSLLVHAKWRSQLAARRGHWTAVWWQQRDGFERRERKSSRNSTALHKMESPNITVQLCQFGAVKIWEHR